MIRRLVPLGAALLLVAGVAPGRPADDKKTDGEITVKEGEEFKLSKDEIVVAKEPEDEGRYPVTVKPAAAPTVVKMPAQKWMLAFTPDTTEKKDGVKIESVVDTGPLQQMRAVAKMKEAGGWMADPGDVITHVNGYAVKTVKDVICAVNAAEDHADIQLVLKDVNNGKPYVFYVSAVKR